MENELFKTIINSNHSIIVGIDYNNITRIFNSGAEQLTGYKKEEVIGKKWNELFLAFEDQEKLDLLWRYAWEKDYDQIFDIIEDNIDIKNNSWEYVEKTQACNLIGPLQVKSGEIKTIFWQNTKIYKNDDIEKHLLISVGIDITNQKKIEKELIEAKKKAEESNRLKTEFLNNISHEIRTPMNAIIGFSDILESFSVSEKDRLNYINIIKDNGYKLLKIIDSILEISKLEIEENKVNNSIFCLNSLLIELHTIFSLKLIKKEGVEIILKNGLADDLSYIISDQDRLDQILNCLLNNALKFTDRGVVEFGYNIESETIKFYVKDTGIGVSSNLYKTIFENFSQGNKELFKLYGGLGLGLSISKKNAQLLGGDISLKSEKGKGSIFFLEIPYKPV